MHYIFSLQVLLHVNEYATISVYSATALIAAIAAFFLPIETRGRSLTVSCFGKCYQDSW